MAQPKYTTEYPFETTKPEDADAAQGLEAWNNLERWNFLSSGWDEGEGDDATHFDTTISALLDTFGGVFADTAEAFSKLIGLFN